MSHPKGPSHESHFRVPRQADSTSLTDVPEPAISDVPGGRGVRVRVLRVGLDGTDKEIKAGEYGAAPDGSDLLVQGHESLGQVVEVGPNVAELVPGDYVVARVRRAGSTLYDDIDTPDMTTDDVYLEHGTRRRRQAHRVRVKRWTASSSSVVFSAATASLPEVRAWRTQWLT